MNCILFTGFHWFCSCISCSIAFLYEIANITASSFSGRETFWWGRMSRGHLGGCPIFRVLGQLRQALKNWPFSGSTPGVLLTPVIIKRANPSNYYDKRYPQGKLQWGGDRPTLAGTYSALGGLLRKHKALLRH